MSEPREPEGEELRVDEAGDDIDRAPESGGEVLALRHMVKLMASAPTPEPDWSRLEGALVARLALERAEAIDAPPASLGARSVGRATPAELGARSVGRATPAELGARSAGRGAPELERAPRSGGHEAPPVRGAPRARPRLGRTGRASTRRRARVAAFWAGAAAVMASALAFAFLEGAARREPAPAISPAASVEATPAPPDARQPSGPGAITLEAEPAPAPPDPTTEGVAPTPPVATASAARAPIPAAKPSDGTASRPTPLTDEALQARLLSCVTERGRAGELTEGVRVALRSELRVQIDADGHATALSFHPPLRPELQSCALFVLSSSLEPGPRALAVPIRLD